VCPFRFVAKKRFSISFSFHAEALFSPHPRPRNGSRSSSEWDYNVWIVYSISIKSFSRLQPNMLRLNVPAQPRYNPIELSQILIPGDSSAVEKVFNGHEDLHGKVAALLDTNCDYQCCTKSRAWARSSCSLPFYGFPSVLTFSSSLISP
jgi:hypothetical protein